MKRNLEGKIISTVVSTHNFVVLLSHSKIMRIITSSENDKIFSNIVVEAFTESFIVVVDDIYNKSTMNTLIHVGKIDDKAMSLVKCLLTKSYDQLDENQAGYINGAFKERLNKFLTHQVRSSSQSSTFQKLIRKL
mmetsp:Transcript_38/g.52  ORF Transcript_38/g.52 Transcript_38/m.52 type:complete len:135 (-) Transcript_38:671-1075(-)